MILAIKGHKTRGKEVIQLLEMLGGVNDFTLEGTQTDGFYYIFKDNNKIYHCWNINTENVIIYTLEEFEEKFPYKVGDKVTLYKFPCIITEMYWEYDDVIYYVKGDDFSKGVYSTDKDLQHYEEENYCQVTGNDTSSNGVNTSASSINEETVEEPEELIIGFTKDDNDDWVLNIHKDYEIKEIECKFKVIKKQPQYPKYYFECCEVLGLGIMENYGSGYKLELITHLQNLLICRDAYWKIAGEQMGLDKPWGPDWCNENDLKYCIECSFGTIDKTVSIVNGCFLAFPTKEMRDAFYENFKDLIEECKRLL